MCTGSKSPRKSPQASVLPKKGGCTASELEYGILCFSAGSVRNIALLYWDNNIYINIIGCKIKSPRKAKVTRSPGKSNPSVASSKKSIAKT